MSAFPTQPPAPDEAGRPLPLATYLRPGERLLWSGKPDPNVRFTRADGYIVPFSLFYGGLAIVFESVAITSGLPLAADLICLALVAIGLYLLFGRFAYKRWAKLRTDYGITTDRALVAMGSTLHESPLRQIPTSSRRSPDGKHISITFGARRAWSTDMYANTGLDLLNLGSPVAFYDVADEMGLRDALRNALSS